MLGQRWANGQHLLLCQRCANVGQTEFKHHQLIIERLGLIRWSYNNGGMFSNLTYIGYIMGMDWPAVKPMFNANTVSAIGQTLNILH